ncbi:exonuclease protein [Caulobacter phage Cr30]|uniref:exonuclease n=1 Tax=Caulobacter phage Cr30 TaxID=1357714 RepID=UPI0004A9B8A9|nr:exonuclease [Caulobacter phage Cr30]AGS80989.1 exonuclease protein [Caulobacter phage Cr30]
MSFKDKFAIKDPLGPPKQFQHKLFKKMNLERVDSPDGRRYLSEDGKTSFPSVTTVLGATADKSFLDEWRERIGIEEANKITSQSSRRGTVLHEMCEKYTLNDPKYYGNPTPIYANFFGQIRPYLDQHMDNIRGCELPVYSNYLKIAGTTDNISDYRNVASVVDYKNSRRPKTKEDIVGYFVQTAIYAICCEERYGLVIPQLVILMAVEGNQKGEEFIEPRKKYDNEALKIIKEYYSLNK